MTARADMALVEAVRNREQRRNDRLHDQAVIRSGLRHLLTGNESHKSLLDCGNPVPEANHTTIERDQNGRISYGNLVRCGSKQLCVSCAGKGRAEEASLVSWRIDQHFEAGKAISMLTVAPRHDAGERLAPNKACLAECFADTWRSRTMQAVLGVYGVEGTAKVLEITHGTNGHHPHLHVLMFHERFIDVPEGDQRELIHTFSVEFNKRLARWNQRACRHPKAAVAGVKYTTVADEDGRQRRKATYKPVTNAEWYGLDPSQERYADLAHGINFVPIARDGDTSGRIAAYVGKIALEMTRSDLKTGKTEGSRSLFQIMADYGRTREPVDGALIIEIADVLKGVQLVSWTGAFHGTEPLYGQPTDDYQRKAMVEYYQAQGLEPPDEEDGTERTTLAGVAPDVHRAADRATSLDGHPLLWKARLVLEQAGELEAFVQVLNEVLTPVVIDRTTELAYPIIRYEEPPTVALRPADAESGGPDLKAALRQIRSMGAELRAETIARARQGLLEPYRPESAQLSIDQEGRWTHGNQEDLA